MTNQLRVLIVDGERSAREGIKRLLLQSFPSADVSEVDSCAGAIGQADRVEARKECAAELGQLHSELQLEAAQQLRLGEELEQARERLASQNQELLHLSQLANDFIDRVSHDLRAPLAVIKESASILHDGLLGPLAAEQNEYVAAVLDRASDLTVMVDDLLDMSRLQAGILTVRRRYVPMKDVFDRIRPMLTLKAEAARVELELRCDPELPAVYCDSGKLRRAIVNLVGSVLKLCGEGNRIRILACRDPDVSQVRVDVTNDGPGISRENLKKLYRKFQQAESPWSAIKGFGLGLDVVRELVRLNLGEVSVESEPGRGSTFRLTLPCGPPGEVLRRHLAQLEQPPKGPVAVTLLLAETETCEHQGAHNEVEAFLQHFLRRNDLLFRNGDAWLLAAACDARGAARLIERFENVRRDAGRSRPEGQLPRLRLTPEFTWPRGDNIDPLLAAMDDVLSRHVAEL